MISKMVIRASAGLLLGAALSLTGCGDSASDGDKAAEADKDGDLEGGAEGGVVTGDMIVMSGQLALTGTALTAGIADLELFCLTFEDTPRAVRTNFGEGGTFSVEMYSNVAFGCFINDTVTKKTVGSFVAGSGGSGDGLAGGNSSTIAFNQSIDLGNLVMNPDGSVVIPAAVIAKASSGVSSKLNPGDIHDNYFVMTCQKGADATRAAACEEFMKDGGGQFGVFLRVLKGTKDGKDVYGMGVWEDKAGFTACGAVDVTEARKAKIMSEDGITFSQIAAGAFTPGEACPLRKNGGDNQGGDGQNNGGNNGGPTDGQQLAEDEHGTDTLDKYYALGKLTPTAAGFSFLDKSERTEGTCKESHSTAIEFAGSGSSFVGAFTSADARSGCNGEDGNKAEYSSFSVVFTKK